MSASTSVYSNAFNFSAYVETGVDPRTGQYTIGLRLPKLKGNDLQGPDFELKLFYTPLNTVDSGFGKGWNLQLTQVRRSGQGEVLTLSSGETYKITDEEADGRLLMREQKLVQFTLYREAAAEPGGPARYRVVHRSGLVEVLQMTRLGQEELALPVELHSPLWHSLRLEHRDPFGSDQEPFLKVSDSQQTLLEVMRGSGQVEIRCYPHGGDDGGPLARYRLTLSSTDNRVSDIRLPTANQARWQFSYRPARGFLCISEVHTPYGAHESLFYDDAGHALPPSADRANLPRVTRHEIAPGFGQPTQVVTYSYPGLKNFLGGGSSITWSNDGQDNLYKVDQDYKYESIESHLLDGQPIRAITRTFNRFHLLTHQRTVQGDNVLESIIGYGDIDDDFQRQPPQFQLPVSETERWSLLSQPGKQRQQLVTSSYDNHGNLLTRTQANGVTEIQQWYGAAEEGFPGDGHGFVRHLKSRTVIPAASGEGTAATLQQRYRYRALVPQGEYLDTPWLVVESEMLVDLDKPDEVLQQTCNDYYEQPGELSWRYGRLACKTLSFPDEEPGKRLDTVIAYRYSKTLDGLALQVDETRTGYDGEAKSITLQHDLQTGEPLLSRDDNDIEIRYQYDALRRVTRETVAPGTEYEAFRQYRYFLCAYDNEQAQQWAYDVKQVETHSLFDGLSRVIFEERGDPDSATFAGASRPIYRARYDALGQLCEETEIDWLGDQLLELTSRYHYDDWGGKYSVTSPDGVINIEQTDQVASPEGPVQRNWRERDDRRNDAGERIPLSGVVQTHFNLFEEPTRIERFALDGNSISLQVNTYDGLGRISSQAQGRGAARRVELFEHDPYDRLLRHRLADGTNSVYRTYARHSQADLPVSIRVGSTFASARLLGEQAFDGLERRISATTGGRLQKFIYDPGQQQPRLVVAPDGSEIEYRYLPMLSEEPQLRVLMGATANYRHDRRDGRLMHCDESGQQVDRTYFSNGDLKTETRTLDADTYSMTYSHSYRSRLRSYQDVQGQTQVNTYDGFGRLSLTELHAAPAHPSRIGLRHQPTQVLLSASFDYDELGRLETTTTVDVATGQQLRTSLQHDGFDRETLRTFDFGDSVQTLEQGYDEFDCLEYRTLRQRSADQDEEHAELLRHETYQYDLRGRLQVYTCQGPLAPVDPSGMVIARQVFGFDALDNITSLITTSPDGQVARTLYRFDNLDPVQLSSIVNRPAPDITLEYDANGNLIRDEKGRKLHYDGLNRLLSVLTPEGERCQYHYDPENILSGTSVD